MRLTQLFLRLTQLIVDCGQLFSSFTQRKIFSSHLGFKGFLNVKILSRSHLVSKNKIMFRIIKFEKFQKIKSFNPDCSSFTSKQIQNVIYMCQ